MKTMILTTTLLCLSSIAQAAPLSDGNFRGEGLWRSENARGAYEVVTSITGNLFSSSYKLANGETREIAIELQPTANGFLRVLSNGSDAGSGYCLDRVELCHYELKTDKLTLEETLTIQNGKLYKFGSKTEGGVTVMWQEALGK